jgi:hypothetical protein
VSSRPRITTFAAGALVSLALLGAGCGSSGGNKAGGGGAIGRNVTLKLHSGGTGGGYSPLETKHHPPGAPWAGFTRTDPLLDSSGAKAGIEDVVCLWGAVKGRVICDVTMSLNRGTVVAHGVFTGGALGGTLAVTGGSGAYEGARGTYETTSPGPEPLLIQVHLLLP